MFVIFLRDSARDIVYRLRRPSFFLSEPKPSISVSLEANYTTYVYIRISEHLMGPPVILYMYTPVRGYTHTRII